MKKILLIGYGVWGKKIYKKIKSQFNVDIIKNRNSFKKNKFLNFKYDLVIIACNTQNHFNVIKKIPKKNKKIFCEKPLTFKYQTSLKIMSFVSKKKQNIYISDIENYKNLKLKFKKNNFVLRSKNKSYTFLKLLYSLVYHDLYLHHNIINNKKIKNINIFKKKYNYTIEFTCNKKKFLWKYLFNKNKRTSHFINNTNIKLKKDFILLMIKKVIKNNNFKKNNLIAIDTIKILNKFYKKYKKNYF